jgi:D-3-phosphoglycerate dehydrogenase
MKKTNIKLMNKIAAVGTDVFDRSMYNVSDSLSDADAIMVRSASLHDAEFDKTTLAIARCGAGVNNIPIDRCTDEGIVVFNTPGANANGVKELTICALALASRDIIGGANWASTLTENVAGAVEKGKSAFGGCEFAGKTLGVVGLGAIGGMVANAAEALGMNVIGYDPYVTVDATWHLSGSIAHATKLEEIFEKSDYITLHVPAVASTKEMICKKNIEMMKDGVRIINLARADLVVAEDVKEALEKGKIAKYVTDFPTEEVVGVKGIVAIPHLGASTAESEDNCAVMAARQLDVFLRTGNIRNSVNFPNIEMPCTGRHRLVVLHRNIPDMIAKVTSAVSEKGINIADMMSKAKGDVACTILELDGNVQSAEEICEKIANINGIIRVRIV